MRDVVYSFIFFVEAQNKMAAGNFSEGWFLFSLLFLVVVTNVGNTSIWYWLQKHQQYYYEEDVWWGMK